MTDLKNKQILFIGTGNMGLPVLQSMMAESNRISANKLTIIAGTSEGKDSAAVEQILSKSKFSGAPPQITNYQSVNIATQKKPDIIVLAVKPHMAQAALTPLKDLISDDTIIISSAAALTAESIEKYTQTKPKVAHMMPHIPQVVCGYYGQHSKANAIAQQIGHQLGDPIMHDSQEKMHAHTAIAGSGPAFVAEFVAHYDAELQPVARKWLNGFASGKFPKIYKHTDEVISKEAMNFYNNFLAASVALLGNETGNQLTDATIAASCRDIANAPDLKEYIASVRSAHGTTNAGLLCMGNAPPAEEKFGNVEELETQNAMAKKALIKFKTPEKAVGAAIFAATDRCAAISNGKLSALDGVSLYGAAKKAEAALKEQLSSNKSR